MTLENGIPTDEIIPENLSWADKRKYRKFQEQIKKGIPKLETSYAMVIDALQQVKSLKSKSKKEKAEIEMRIRNDIINSLLKSMDVLQIIDKETGEEETELSLKEKSTEVLLKYLLENIEEMKKFVDGK